MSSNVVRLVCDQCGEQLLVDRVSREYRNCPVCLEGFMKPISTVSGQVYEGLRRRQQSLARQDRMRRQLERFRSMRGLVDR